MRKGLSSVGARLCGVGLAAALAAVTLALAVTGRLGLYINPESSWFAVSMAVLALIGTIVTFALPLGAEADHGHDHGTGRGSGLGAGSGRAPAAGPGRARAAGSVGPGTPYSRRGGITPPRGEDSAPGGDDFAPGTATVGTTAAHADAARDRPHADHAHPHADHAHALGAETSRRGARLSRRGGITPPRGEDSAPGATADAARDRHNHAAHDHADHAHAAHDHAHHEHGGGRMAGIAAATGGVLATGIVAAVLLVPPASLSAEIAISRDTGAPPLFQGADTVMLAAMGDTASFGVGEWASVFATATNPEAFDGDEVTLTGFVTPGDTGNGFDLTRLVITHCVIDAQPASVAITADGGPSTGQWVTVTGTIRDVDGALQIVAASVDSVDEPEDPYEY